MDLNQVDLNLLLAFDVLLDERSVTRAATRLCIGQSAMSSTLARLRRLLNDPVLVRVGREMVASPLAESLVKPVREVLDEIESILAGRTEFEPGHAVRTFTVVASDYTMLTFLTPLLLQLKYEAPGIHLWVSPPSDDYVERIRRGQVDLVIMPREVFTEYQDFPHRFLFQDRFVVALDARNDSVGASISMDEFSALPYLATSCGHEISPAEAQLDLLGIRRNTEVTTAFGLAPILLQGTSRIALIHERLAWAMAQQAPLRLLEPPMPLQPINQLMLWTSRTDRDPGHQWLRHRIEAFAAELEPPPRLPVTRAVAARQTLSDRPPASTFAPAS